MKKILMADDDIDMLSLLKTLLGMDGYQVTTLSDKSGDIVEKIRAEKPDVLLIDIYLGEYNGLDVVRRIRRMPDLKRLQIIVVSGADKAQECLAAGADQFLLKPYMPDELLAILRQ